MRHLIDPCWPLLHYGITHILNFHLWNDVALQMALVCLRCGTLCTHWCIHKSLHSMLAQKAWFQIGDDAQIEQAIGSRAAVLLQGWHSNTPAGVILDQHSCEIWSSVGFRTCNCRRTISWRTSKMQCGSGWPTASALLWAWTHRVFRAMPCVPLWMTPHMHFRWKSHTDDVNCRASCCSSCLDSSKWTKYGPNYNVCFHEIW